MKLSVVVVTMNEEANLPRCLKSVRWADEIVVVDSFSTDATVEVARTFTDHVYQHEYPGYSRQVERAVSYASGEWILIVDADEAVSPELALEIQSVVSGNADRDGFFVNRKVFAFGSEISHCGWFPDWQFRLARKDRLVAEHLEIHGGFTCTGEKGRLNGLLFHYTYGSIHQYIEKINEYTSLHVSNKLAERSRRSVGLHKLILSPLSLFLRMFVVNKGYKDGMAGFVLSAYSALYSMLLYAKLWEYHVAERSGNERPPVTNAELRDIRRRYA